MVKTAIERGTTDNVTAVVATIQAAQVRELILTGARGPSPLMPLFLAVAAIIILAVIVAVFFLL
jgi:hypothetical protein